MNSKSENKKIIGLLFIVSGTLLSALRFLENIKDWSFIDFIKLIFGILLVLYGYSFFRR